MTILTRRYRFCASHRLNSEALTPAQNELTYGKCNNPYGHGHDYVLDVAVTGEIDEFTGLIVRVASLDEMVKDVVLTDFGFRNLNTDLVEFAHLVPTTENVALVIAGRLRESWDNYFPYSQARLHSISMHETDRNSFEVLLPKENRVTSAFDKSKESVTVNA